jgi:hypothetical protein
MPLKRMRSPCWWVQDFEGVAVEDGDTLAREVGGVSGDAHNNTKAALHRSTRPLFAIIGKVMSTSSLLHLLGVLIDHQVGIGRSVKHDVAS